MIARKEMLLRASKANRDVLREEARNLQPVVAWVDFGVDVTRKVRAGWTTLFPLLSWWRKGTTDSSGFVDKMTGAVSIVRSLLGLWKMRL